MLPAATGLWLKLAPPFWLTSSSLSRDARELALLVGDDGANSISVQVLPVAGGKPRVLFRRPSTSQPKGVLDWLADGRRLLLAWDAGSARSQLHLIPTDGGQTRSVELAAEAVRFLRVRPDGRQVAFTAGHPGQGEVWVLENFRQARSRDK